MTTIVKKKLSASTDGKLIKVAATATAGTLIHTSRSDTGAGQWDEIWIEAINTDLADVALTIEWGGTTSPDDEIIVGVPSQSGLVMVVNGLILHNSCAVRAFAATANVVNIGGWVHEVTP